MLGRRQQVLANNLANASTRGFKGETAFARLIGDAMATTDTALDLTQGNLTETHNALDLAIQHRRLMLAAARGGMGGVTGGIGPGGEGFCGGGGRGFNGFHVGRRTGGGGKPWGVFDAEEAR